MAQSRRIGYMLGGLALLLAGFSQGALQGEPGETQSNAVTTITLSIEPNIQISNVSDIQLDVTDRSRDISHEERICVRGNVGSRYSVTADNQDGSKAPFTLTTGTGEEIDFEVYFRGDLSRATGDQLFPGERSPFYTLSKSGVECDGDNNAAFTVLFKSDDLLPAEPGIYSGFLTLTVAAE